jgi:hypothetical protein
MATYSAEPWTIRRHGGDGRFKNALTSVMDSDGIEVCDTLSLALPIETCEANAKIIIAKRIVIMNAIKEDMK